MPVKATGPPAWVWFVLRGHLDGPSRGSIPFSRGGSWAAAPGQLAHVHCRRRGHPGDGGGRTRAWMQPAPAVAPPPRDPPAPKRSSQAAPGAPSLPTRPPCTAGTLGPVAGVRTECLRAAGPESKTRPFVCGVDRSPGYRPCRHGRDWNSHGREQKGRSLPGSSVRGQRTPLQGCTSDFGDRPVAESSQRYQRPA